MKMYILRVDGLVVGKVELSPEEVKILSKEPGIIVERAQ